MAGADGRSGNGEESTRIARPSGDGSAVPADAGPNALEVVGINFSYGHVQVLFGIDFVVRLGGRVAILGPNGVGKTTLLRVVAGLLQPSAGSVRFNGEDVTGLPAHARARRGMTLVEGGRAVFPSLTVLQNLRMGAYPVLEQRDVVAHRLEEVLELFPPLRTRLTQSAGTLSGGERQMLALGRGLMADAKLFMIDELSLGLAPIVLQALLTGMDELVRRGKTLLVVEQSANIALGLAEQVHFMEKGEIHFTAPAQELLADRELLHAAYLGTAGR